MFNVLKKFVKKYVTLYGITVFIGIITTLCLVYFAEEYHNQGKKFFLKYNFEFYLFLALCVIWIVGYLIYFRRQFIQFVKFVIDEKIITEKKIEKLNRNTRNLIEIHTNKENEVA